MKQTTIKALAYTLLVLLLLLFLLKFVFIYPYIASIFVITIFALGVYSVIYKHLEN